ncbi:hypothetical protein PF010_g11646 [Phytophthora fragariae]|uniref:Secreted protein n=1 Tax=Phytophthora fragariae TaxID=53985 RepID=A0A6G0L501_9STRA|nr:hypothetical protein PF010_g11646 [Phytophthora fragariae]
MNGSDTAVVCAVVLSRAAAAIAVAVDGRSVRAAPSRVSTFSSTTFERAMRAKDTSWFHKKLRCERQSFLLVYQAVYAAWGDKPGANAKRSVLKRGADHALPRSGWHDGPGGHGNGDVEISCGCVYQRVSRCPRHHGQAPGCFS